MTRRKKEAKIELWERGLARVDNTFIDASILASSSTDYNVFLAVIGRLGEVVPNAEGRIVSVIKFSDIRKITGLPNMKTADIVRSMSDLLGTQVRFYRHDGRIDSVNVFDRTSISPDRRSCEITLSESMAEVLGVARRMNEGELVQYTLLGIIESSSMRSIYSKEVYKQLRKYRTTGVFTMNMDKFLRVLQLNEKELTEYKLIRDYLIPAIDDNKQFFKGLSYNLTEGMTKLPSSIRITFERDKYATM